MTMDFLTTNVSTGEQVQRIPTAEELAVREAIHAQGAADAQAELQATADMLTRDGTLTKIRNGVGTSWPTFEGYLDDALVALPRPRADWTNALIVDGIKLALRIGLWCASRELRRIIRERDRG